MALYHKYRPTSIEEMLGNRDTLEILKEVLSGNKEIPQAFLLHGPTGCGKTTLARIIANELGVKGSDFREVDSADFRGIDTVRDIRRQSNFVALESSCKVWLLDECHKLSNDAQNALLKGLEDPPKHVYYILATTDPQKLISTIKGRCSQYELKPLTDNTMFKLIRKVVRGEEENLDKDVYDQIIMDSQGLPRNALQILEQVLIAPEDKRLQTAKRQAEVQTQSIELCRALIKNLSWGKISSILSDLKENGQDPENIRRQVLGYCQAVLLKDNEIRVGRIMEEFIEPFYNTGFPGLVYACYAIVEGN
jgi:DNA polymerase-3 subunit gamma/tau